MKCYFRVCYFQMLTEIPAKEVFVANAKPVGFQCFTSLFLSADFGGNRRDFYCQSSRRTFE